MSDCSVGERERAAILVLRCQQGSHPFSDRTIELTECVKVGRTVARVKPTRNNAIFDCKVLSRSHALAWYKDGHFWLRDTNSSNGTFVNDTRIAKRPNDQFADREIFSGDVIRFGVDVMERDTKHGCIIAQVFLYHPNGAEAKQCPENSTVLNGTEDMDMSQAEQMFRLTHFIGEALYREQMFDNKLESINQLLQETREISEAGWQAMLSEERLLERLDVYETQIALLKKDLPEDSLQSHLYQALEDRSNLEKASKVMLERVLNEKTEALSKVANLESCLADSERECARLRQDCEATQAAYQTMAGEFQSKLLQLSMLESQFQLLDKEKQSLEQQLTERTQEVDALRAVPSNRLKEPPEEFPHAEVNGLDASSPVRCSDQLNQLNSVDQLRSSLAQRLDVARDELLSSELGELDQFRDIQERLRAAENGLEQVLDRTSGELSSILTDGLRQFAQSVRSVRSLQDQLVLLSEALGEDASEQSELLARVRNLVMDAATCHAQAGASLVSFCACQPSPAIDHLQARDADATTTPPDTPTDDELDRLRTELRESMREREQLEQLAEMYRQQDDCKAELLSTVRGECERLRERIAEIESSVQHSRADHQRLVQEAKRAAVEVETLQLERDALREQVAAFERDRGAAELGSGDLVRPEPPQRPLCSAPVPSQGRKPNPMLVLFVVLPLMVLVYALMASVFARFTVRR